MSRIFEGKVINRIIDANINRAKEGLRVCEEISRFVLDSRALTGEFKKARHKIGSLLKDLPVDMSGLLKERKSTSDVGKDIYINELKRRDLNDIFFANIQRVKESIRVLEEFAKLKDTRIAKRFKQIRYDIYEIEKKTFERLKNLRHL